MSDAASDMPPLADRIAALRRDSAKAEAEGEKRRLAAAKMLAAEWRKMPLFARCASTAVDFVQTGIWTPFFAASNLLEAVRETAKDAQDEFGGLRLWRSLHVKDAEELRSAAAAYFAAVYSLEGGSVPATARRLQWTTRQVETVLGKSAAKETEERSGEAVTFA